MSETEVEDSENNAEGESDITTSPETEDIVEKKVTRRQLCGRGLDVAKATRSSRSRSAKYAGGWYLNLSGSNCARA